MIEPDGDLTLKDRDLLEMRIASGRFTPAGADSIVALGDEIGTHAPGRRDVVGSRLVAVEARPQAARD